MLTDAELDAIEKRAKRMAEMCLADRNAASELLLVAEVRRLRAQRADLGAALLAGIAGLHADGERWAKRNDGLGFQVSMERHREAEILRLAYQLTGCHGKATP